MNCEQQLLIDLLSAAIRGRAPENVNTEGIDWRAVYQEAKAHDVYSLVYPVLEMLESFQRPDTQLMAEWRRASQTSGIRQVQHLQQICEVLRQLNHAGIEAVPLKGLVVRSLYPHPELRSMSDADLLVRTEYLERTKEILLQMHYLCTEDTTEKHLFFEHEIYPAIELHRLLLDENRLKNSNVFEREIWERVVPGELNQTPVLFLSSEDLAIHLCIHMAGHFITCGFGLRQLCDFVLLIESSAVEMDWNLFRQLEEQLGIALFVSALFAVFSRLFGMKIPAEVKLEIPENDSLIDLFIDDIFDGGLFGRKTSDRIFANSMLRYSNPAKGHSGFPKTAYYLSLLFPSAQKLHRRFSYAKKLPLLLPAAWIHRLIRIIRQRKMIRLSRSLLRSPHAPVSILEERAILLQRLGLMK